MKLYPFQVEAVAKTFKILSKYRGSYNASDTGVGKTAMTLGFIKQYPNTFKKILIVCPAILQKNWENECSLWLPNLSCGRIRDHLTFDINIQSYEIFSKFTPSPVDLNSTPLLTIFDEAHYLKSLKALRTKAMLHHNSTKYLFLSGTPFVNSTTDAFPCFRKAAPSLFPSFQNYADKYSNKHIMRIRNRSITQYKGSKNIKELESILKDSIFFRYRKEEVLPDLPELSRLSCTLECSKPPVTQEEFREALSQFQSGNYNAPSISRLRQTTGVFKAPLAALYAENLLSQGKPIIIFAHHREVISILQAKLSEHNPQIVHGDISTTERQTAFDSFQVSQTSNLLIMNIQAGGVGLNLQRASDIVFAEFDWTFSQNMQAESRAHRNGQVNNVTSHYLLLENSLDETVYRTVMSKKTLHEGIS